MKPFWESEYQNKERTTFGNPSPEVAELAQHLPRGARVLDVGCGDGRHALYLAGLGFQVDAFDVSENAIAKLDYLKDRHGLQINTCVCDAMDFSLAHRYDLVILHGVLQFVAREKQPLILERLKFWTSVGGYHVVALFTDEEPVPDDLRDVMVGVFKEGEIKRYYGDWDVQMFESRKFRDEHENGIRHCHAMNKIVAQKPVATVL